MVILDFVLAYQHSERGVTANIPVLGTGDSGFESRRSDKKVIVYEVFVLL